MNRRVQTRHTQDQSAVDSPGAAALELTPPVDPLTPADTLGGDGPGTPVVLESQRRTRRWRLQ